MGTMLAEILAAARGDSPCDLVIRDARTVNTFTGEVMEGHLGIKAGRIAGVGDYRGLLEVDAGGAFALPGFIEGHFHIESSMLRPAELARVILPRGTTCLVADPHEIANVAGLAGIEFILADSENLPLDIFLMAPSCVPATTFETSGASIGPREIEHLYGHPRVLGLAELMNYPAVVRGESGIISKIEASRGRPMDGHAPLLSGLSLNAYAAAGIGSDHEVTSVEEAREKLRAGMRIMIREGTSARDLKNLLSAVTDHNYSRFLLVTDDRHPNELSRLGHMDHLLRTAVAQGHDPIRAIRMVTVNPAAHFGLADRGALVPGYLADVVLVSDLVDFEVLDVFKSGRHVATGSGGLTAKYESATIQPALVDTVRLERVSPRDLTIGFSGSTPLARIINLLPDSIMTRAGMEQVHVDQSGIFLPDPELSCLFVFERHRGSGRVGKGIVRGFGIQKGALASSVAHDSHNLICVCSDPDSASAALNALKDSGGGFAVAINGKVLKVLSLPIAGLLYDGPVHNLLKEMDQLLEAARETGSPLEDPFMVLSMLALPVIPELKLTDMGLVDVGRFELVDLEVGE